MRLIVEGTPEEIAETLLEMTNHPGARHEIYLTNDGYSDADLTKIADAFKEAAKRVAKHRQ